MRLRRVGLTTLQGDSMTKDTFFSSREWRTLRYQAIRKYGQKCAACKRSAKSDNVTIHVDHIKPRFIYPELSLDIENLQILCEDCNIGKSYMYEDRWIAKPQTAAPRQNIRKTCSHHPYWENKVVTQVFKNGGTHFRMECKTCQAVIFLKRRMGQKILSLVDAGQKTT